MRVAVRQAMRFRELRALLQSIVIAGLPACGSVDDPVCYQQVEKSFDVVSSPDDPQLRLRIESCRVDADACTDLCAMLMERAQLPSPSTCSVTFDADQAHVTTTYLSATGGPNCPSEGRRPLGLVEPRHIDAPDEVARWLAHAAWLEAASIPAFVYLARELDQLGAPRGLVRAALAAVHDEIRHARVMTALAARRGARVPAVRIPEPASRSVEELAIENAVEGCVRETWGAVVARWQAHRARNAELRTVFAAIAEDEARHAALAWEIDRWARTHLDRDACARIDASRQDAIRALFREPDASAHALLGIPTGIDARGLRARTAAALWT